MFTPSFVQFVYIKWMDYKKSEINFLLNVASLHQLGHIYYIPIGSILLELLFLNKESMDLNPNNRKYSISIIVLVSSRTPGRSSNTTVPECRPAPPVTQLFIFVLYHVYLHDQVCVLSLFYDHQYCPPDHYYAGLWSCPRLGLNSSNMPQCFTSRTEVLCSPTIGVDGRTRARLIVVSDGPFLPPLYLDIGGIGGPCLFQPLITAAIFARIT